MRNPIDFTPPEVYKQMDEQAKYHRKFMVRLLILDMVLFALISFCIMLFVVTIISLIKSA